MAQPASKRARSESFVTWSQSERPARRPTVRFDEDAETPDEDLVLAIASTRKAIGASYLDPFSRRLYVLEDASDLTDAYDLVGLLIEQVRPDLILVSSRADETLIDRVRDELTKLNDADASVTREIQIRPSREFSEPTGRAGLKSLRVLEALADSEERGGTSAGGTDENDGSSAAGCDGSNRLASFVNMHASLMLASVAALLGCLARTSAIGELPGREGLREVLSIRALSFDKIVRVNGDALHSLQIISDEAHANTTLTSVKEGLSLFGVVNRTCTPLGKILLRQWLLRPSREIDVIAARQDGIECLLREENNLLVEPLRKALKAVKNVPRIMQSLHEGNNAVAAWTAIVKAAIQIREQLRGLNGAASIDVFEKVCFAFDIASLRTLGESINRNIDWQESQRERRIVIRYGIDPELDAVRRQFDALPSMLARIADSLLGTLPEGFTSSLVIVYFPQIGYLCATPVEDMAEDGRDRAPEDWTFHFSTDESYYWKSPAMFELDEEWGDLRFIAQDMELDIVVGMQQTLHSHEPSMLATADALAELDCIVSLAMAARAYDWQRPEISLGQELIVRGARHPLVELSVPSFVPNDCKLVGGPKVKEESAELMPVDDETHSGLRSDLASLVVTGANGGGKSVYLKSIALIVLLAHVGSFVPAEHARIAQAASAFMIDLQQISYMLRNATESSLLLIDEFGKGTESADGQGLFGAVLEHVAQLGARALVATHFTGLFLNRQIDAQRLGIGLAHMDIHLDAAADADMSELERVVCLYSLAPGLASTSHAASCAQQFGIPPRVNERAAEVSRLLLSHDYAALTDRAMSESERDQLRLDERVVRGLLALDLDKTDDVRGALKSLLEAV